MPSTLGIALTEPSSLLMECNRIVDLETGQNKATRPAAVYMKFKFERPLSFVHSSVRRSSTGFRIYLLLNSFQVLSH